MTPEPDFSQDIAVVTGAGGTLCSAIARNLARGGAKVALLGRTRETLARVAIEIAAEGGDAHVAVADVNDASQLDHAKAEVHRVFGPCTMLINGAGGNHPDSVTTLTRFDPKELDGPSATKAPRGFFNLDAERFADVLQTNTMGTVLPCRVFGRDMVQAGNGAILNFASMNTYRPLTRVAAYAMAKSAVANFTQWLAVYLAPANVRVNAIAPGFFVNERSKRILMADDGGLSPRGEQVLAHTPLGRFGQPDDLLGCARWLLDHNASAFVTGQTVAVDGGFLASAGV